MVIKTIFIILLGFLTAGIINYLADVLPVERRLIRPVCYFCHQPYRIPSYLLYLKCSHCHINRTKRSWFTLAGVPIVFLYLWFFPPNRLNFWMAILIFSYFCLVVIIDIEHRLILNILSVSGLMIALPLGIILHRLLATVFGGLMGLGIMFVLYLLGIGFIRLLSTIKKKQYNEVALGFGDVSLSFIIGLILGFPGIIAAILLAILLGGFFSLIYLIGMFLFHRYRPLTAIPYAPFLALSTLILLFR